MNESQAILEPRAQEVLDSYKWDRFTRFDDKRSQFGHNVIAHCHELEKNYRGFIDYLVGQTEYAWAPRVASGHLNFLRDFASTRESGKEFEKRDQGQAFFYKNMGDQALDTLVRFLKTEDEGKILLPKYWATEFADAQVLEILYVQRCNRFETQRYKEQGFADNWIENHLKRFPPINKDNPVFTMNSRFEELMDENGQEQVKATLREKIPRFPQEVHDLRVQVLNEAQIILNALYDTAAAYEQKLVS